MSRTSLVYRSHDSVLSSRSRADAVLSLCYEGNIDGAAEMLGPCEVADDLLAHGITSYWLARVGTGRTYEEAKDLLSEASRLFEESGEPERARLADIWLGLCYWLQGQFAEAFILLNRSAESNDPNVKFYALIQISVLQTEYKRWQFSLATLSLAQPLFDSQDSYSWRGKFFQQRALSYKQAYEETKSRAYLNNALMDYEAASDHFETAGNVRFEAAILNNIANLYRVSGDLQRARNNADRAMGLYERVGDRSHLAHAKDTKAMILLDAGELLRAKQYAQQSIALLRKHDPAWVTIPLVTRARINFRMGFIDAAEADFQEAIEVAESSGNGKHATGIYLDMAETLIGSLSAQKLVAILNRINELQPSRELAIAQTLLERTAICGGASLEDLKSNERKQEHEIILAALEQASGSVTRAAKALGKTHGGLTHIIKTRHPDLLMKCRPIVPRPNRSITSPSG